MNKNTPMVTVKSAYDALSAAGFPKSFVTRLLPDWWDNALFKTSTGAIEFASILKQRLGLDVGFAESGELQVLAADRRARYKKRAATLESELQVCSTLGVAMGKLALFCMEQPAQQLLNDPLMLAKMVRAGSQTNDVSFEALLDLCWHQGVPVLFLKDLPRGSKRITGMALRIEGRPVIVLGYQSNQNAKQLFVLAHELAHVCLGHVDSAGVLIDEGIDAITESIEGAEDNLADAEEHQADEFALTLLRNGHRHLPHTDQSPASPAELTMEAVNRGRDLGIDPGHIILSYARQHDDWLFGNQALGYLPNQKTAMELIHDRFLKHCHVDRLSDDNRAYLLSMQGF
ncbi:ImmA/IrrE family metallo-endopeptidase [Stenotrophomonas maltophilia]|jgi:hypothetical protein|uniref:ImmA/IrrE family metallo-endopeptidase n=1 Tax=Stenotrophomonas maltophilia TaxID=40324 RepID=UPI0015DDD95C|nr:ImmA/IrrE family metallo-endopeptidase [Stenotrophomonas maltophilia]MBA0239817.1 ImmA/IrrE family metallo-endopeptidase [Stenotrophomonas maltophilia]